MGQNAGPYEDLEAFLHRADELAGSLSTDAIADAGGLAIARVEFLAAVHRDEEELGLHGELAANVLIGVVPRPRQTGLLPERDRRLGVGHLEGADLDAHSGESARSAASAAGSVHRMPS